MTTPEQMLEDTKSVTIPGHIRPGGDCLGSTLGLYNYLWLNYLDIRAAVYLEESSPKFSYLKGYGTIRHQIDGECCELCVCLDSDDIQRLGDFKHYLDWADKSPCLDHHVTNTHYGGTSVIPDEASSACEVFSDQLDERELDRYTTECLYTGIIHNIGVFKFFCTPTHTMEITGKLMGKGINFGTIIGNSFYRRAYIQNQILGRALLEDITFFDGWRIFSAIRQSEIEFYGADGKDTDGIIDQLRLTKGVEVAVFFYETGPQEFKVSMHSQCLVNVSRIAAFFGGGGHVRATGCSMSGGIHDVISSLSVHIVRQLDVAPGSQE